jgi:hypothetical protein
MGHHDDDTMRSNREREDMPEHESDDDVAQTSGAGVLSEGGTAIDRGTGTLGGVAQGPDAGEDDDGILEGDVRRAGGDVDGDGAVEVNERKIFPTR